ncbi:hypothetical protein WJX75_002406 [Coccomyxa subellipsoidea]|uniref:EF-hand domain-containing protein n=1 Tax=Coccomyxa subellipsoidea TaxID=248742 RepID=A0ABR2YN96_9CHLO
MRNKHDNQHQDLGSQIEARGIACAREMLLIQTVEEGDTEGVFTAVDTDGNARVDLRELATALAKWTLLVTKPESPLAAAKNLALDLYMIFNVDPLEGFDEEQFKPVLQSWCLFTKISFEVMARWLETALELPDVQLSPEDKMAAQEIADAMRSPEAMAAVVEAHKIDLVFHLWDTDGDGVASRKKLTRALTWYYRLLSQVQEETGGGDAGERRAEVIDFLEQEQRPGLPGLDRTAFRTIVQRFCQLTGLPVPEVCDFLMSAALSGGNTTLEALAEAGSGMPPQPSDIRELWRTWP